MMGFLDLVLRCFFSYHSITFYSEIFQKRYLVIPSYRI